MTWLLVGWAHDGGYRVASYRSAAAAAKDGRAKIADASWLSFRVARVTSEYVRGAVRVSVPR